MLSLNPIALPSSALQKIHYILFDRIYLFFEGKTYPQTAVWLFLDRIDLELTLNNQVQYYSMNFDFDLSFELLCLLPSPLKQNSSQWDSIKFERYSRTLEFRNIPNLSLWRKHLSFKLNQRGFHELFHSIRKIGQGNFAAVYYAVEKEGGNACAVKAFSKEGTYRQAGGKEALVNEIAVMRKVQHRNLMEVYGVYESKNSIYVCGELLAGGSLHSKLRTHNFSSLQIRTLMRDLFSGLQQLHSHSFMHRDLKPQNLLFRTPNLQCVIADFGLAENVNSNPLIFPRCGTPGYIAPQIANLVGQQRYGTVCDMFSMGVIFHQLILGKSPFQAKNYQEVLQLNKLCKINFENFEYQQLPATWLSLLKGLMEKDPCKRLTAHAALEHQFFRKEPLIGRGSDRFKVQLKANEKVIQKCKGVEECINSPLNSGKVGKRQALLKNDSYLKLKSKENTLSKDKKQNRLHSPLLIKSNSKIGDSRFKPLVDHNS